MKIYVHIYKYRHTHLYMYMHIYIQVYIYIHIFIPLRYQTSDFGRRREKASPQLDSNELQHHATKFSAKIQVYTHIYIYVYILWTEAGKGESTSRLEKLQHLATTFKTYANTYLYICMNLHVCLSEVKIGQVEDQTSTHSDIMKHNLKIYTYTYK